METKKYDVMMPLEGNHYPQADEGIDNSFNTLSGPMFNRVQFEDSAMFEFSYMESSPFYSNLNYTTSANAISSLDGISEILKHGAIVYGQFKYNDYTALNIEALQTLSKFLGGTVSEEGVGFFEWSIGFDDDGYARLELWEGGSLRDASQPRSPFEHKVNLGNKPISRESLAKAREELRQKVRDYNTRKMIKDFSDRADKWESGRETIYDYKDVPATNGGSPTGGGGSTPKNNKPKHIV